jgi:hypothetical protein
MIPAGQTGYRPGDVLRDRRQANTPRGPGWLPGSLDETLRHRRSVREFSADPLPKSQLDAVVAAALDADAAMWPAPSHGAVTWEILTAAFHVGGLDPGVYARRGGRDAVLAGPGCASFGALRRQYADAPVLLLICADLNQACRAAGPAGYPAALVRSGTIGYAAWLRTISVGLACSVYGGASHWVTGVARQLDPNLRHLFTVALGTPAQPSLSRDADG